MKVIKVTSEPSHESEKNLLKDFNIFSVDLSPTPLSALTAMKIAKAVERENPEIVMVTRQKDALAAISAKKLVKDPKYKIAYYVQPNSVKPPMIHRPVIDGVDGWIFSSERLMHLYTEITKRKYLVTPISYHTHIDKKNDFQHPLTISWIGDIKDTERLKRVLDTVDETHKNFTLRICGGGIARDVMPAVKYSRGLTNQNQVIWAGESYDIIKEIENCNAVVKTADDITATEVYAMASGRPVLEPQEIVDFVRSPYPFTPGPEHDTERQIIALRSILQNL